MSDLKKNISEMREMDSLAEMQSIIHRLHPLVKLLVTIVYIFIVVSFDKYHFSGLVSMILYPAILFSFSGISVRVCFYKIRFVLPFVCAVGLLNPFFDRELHFMIGKLPVTGGMISFGTMLLKGVLSLCASFLLVATTSIDKICAALRMLHLPKILVNLLLLTYRYITVMMEELSVMVTAYKLRAPGQKGIKFTAWGSFLGQLLLRSMDKAQELYSSMQLRGYDGDFQYARRMKIEIKDIIFGLFCVAVFIVFRKIDIAHVLGNMIVRGNA